ncbi:MAG: Na+/H+ antiporter NhaC family protein [Deltaproteobacteria bacterium]|nr:Na+/H+ antiporter NhaC family protein [Deltaproteobacteria bacterium]
MNEAAGRRGGVWGRLAWTGILVLVAAGLLALLPRTAGTWVQGGPFAMAPPILAIVVALVWRRILLALFIGVWLGAALAGPSDPARSLFHAVWTFTLPTLWDVDSLTMILFTFQLMGMVGILIRCGGIEGLVGRVTGLARGRRSTQALVGGMGLAVFFDDYANAVIVGTTGRPLTDRFRISREKLAYIVDSTSAPVAAVALISTWIGIEIRYLDEQIVHFSGIAASGYAVFLSLIPYRFYCLLALAMVFLVAATGRDFGPMLAAERRALRDGHLVAPGARPMTSEAFQRFTKVPGAPLRWWNAAIPIVAVLAFIFGAFYVKGAACLPPEVRDPLSLDGWRRAFTQVSGTGPIMATAGALGSILAMALAVGQRILGFREALRAWLTGMRSMLPAVGLIALAIALRRTTDTGHLQTAEYLISLLAGVDPLWIPLAVFLVASGVSFATGTSWGTMGILLPVAVPLAASAAAGHGSATVIILVSTAAVLDGAVFGDHCSPISDTTMLSSIGSASDHVDHVRTQLPYAAVCMVVAALAGYVLVPLAGLPPWMSFAGGAGLLLGILSVAGRRAG